MLTLVAACGGRAACGTQARGAAARSNAPDSEARAARSTTTDSTSDPRAVPITSPLAAAGEAEELWMSGYVSLHDNGSYY